MSLNENLYSSSNTSPEDEHDNVYELERLRLELQLYKNQFNSLFENTAHSYLIVDKNYTIININKSAANIFEHEAVILKNSKLDLFITDETRNKLAEIIDETFNTQLKKEFALNFQLKNNDIFSIQIEASVIQNEPYCLLNFIKIYKTCIDTEENISMEATVAYKKIRRSASGQRVNIQGYRRIN